MKKYLFKYKNYVGRAYVKTFIQKVKMYIFLKKKSYQKFYLFL